MSSSMPHKRSAAASHLVGLPSSVRSRRFAPPDAQDRADAEAYLRGQPIRPERERLLRRALAQFGRAEGDYIDKALRDGEASPAWDTTAWIIAGALAREARDDSHAER
jgi:hypothetical protein